MAESNWSTTANGTTLTLEIGDGDGSFVYVGVAVGKRVAEASGSDSWSYTSAAVGKEPSKGLGTGSLAYAGAGVGGAGQTGAATGSFSYAGVGLGKRVSKGTRTDSVSYVGVGLGKHTAKGVGTGSLVYETRLPEFSVWTAYLTEVTQAGRTGTGSGVLGFTGVAVGNTPPSKGSATGSFSFEGAGSATRISVSVWCASVSETTMGAANLGGGSGSFSFTGGLATGTALSAGPWSEPVTVSTSTTFVSGSGTGSFSFSGSDAIGTNDISLSGWSSSVTAETLDPAFRNGMVPQEIPFPLSGWINPPDGAGSGTFSFSGNAAGLGVGRSSGVGVFSYASFIVGKRTPKGSASGGWLNTGAGLGFTPAVDPYKYGAGVGTWKYLGAGVGKRSPKGMATRYWFFSGVAVRMHKGSAASVWHYTGTLVVPRQGTTSGSWSYLGDGYGIASSLYQARDLFFSRLQDNRVFALEVPHDSIQAVALPDRLIIERLPDRYTVGSS